MCDDLLTEYKTLRDEAMVIYNRRAAVQNLGTALFAGLQAVAFMQNVPELAISATLLILAFYHDDIRWFEAGTKIGAYIRNIIEPSVAGLKWESTLEIVHDPQRQGQGLLVRLERLSSRYPMTAIIGYVLSIACLYFSRISGFRIWIDFLVIILSLAWGVRLFVLGTDWAAMHRRWNQRFADIKTKPNKADARDGISRA